MRNLTLMFLLVCACTQIEAQTSTVQQLGAIPATQVTSGLGINIDATNAWEFQQAAAAGVKNVRFGCAWGDSYGGRGGGAELQSPPPNNYSQGYEMPSNCAQGLANAKQYGMTADITASYGPPYQQILALTVTGNAPVGATSVQVSFNSGVGGETLSSIQFPYDYLYGSANYGEITYRHSYPGSLITGIQLSGSNNATINLSSALQVSLPAGTPLKVNRTLYPSAASNSPNDASVLAYVGYVRFLASQCAATGVSCQLGLWNEPSWPDDCWDNRSDCYDQNPGLNEQNYGPNWGFAAAMQNTPTYQGVTYSWAGTDKSGDSSVLTSAMQQYSGQAFSQSNNPVTAQTYHPYGNNPEDNMWNGPCALALQTTNNWTACNTISGSSSNGAEVQLRTLALQRTNPSFNLDFDIGETGFSLAWGDPAHQARYIMRQFLGFMASNIKVIDFENVYDCDQNFAFFNHVNNGDGSCNNNPTASTPGTPRPVYTAVAGLESGLSAISRAPAASYSTSTLTSVASYSGTYPLDIMHMVGSQSGASANSDLVALWQLSTCPASPCWAGLGSPAGAPVVLNIPSGMTVASVINLDTRASVPYSTSGQQISLYVSDDPIGVLVQPGTQSVTPPPTAPQTVPQTPAPVTVQSSSGQTGTTMQLYSHSNGSQVFLTAVLSPPTYGSASTNGANIFFFYGQTVLGYAPLSSGQANLTVNRSSLPAGAQVLATYGGSGQFGASAVWAAAN